MTLQTLSPAVSVSSQLSPHQLADLAAAGFRSVICNVPDGEAGPGQPKFDQIAAAARAVGMQAAYLPVIPGQIGPTEAAAFAGLMNRLPHPVVAYCRSGRRAQSLWALSQTTKA